MLQLIGLLGQSLQHIIDGRNLTGRRIEWLNGLGALCQHGEVFQRRGEDLRADQVDGHISLGSDPGVVVPDFHGMAGSEF